MEIGSILKHYDFHFFDKLTPIGNEQKQISEASGRKPLLLGKAFSLFWGESRFHRDPLRSATCPESFRGLPTASHVAVRKTRKCVTRIDAN